MVDFVKSGVGESKKVQEEAKKVMPYIIIKKSRYTTSPYEGPSSDKAGVPKGHFYANEADAIADAKKLDAVNPVGFDVKKL